MPADRENNAPKRGRPFEKGNSGRPKGTPNRTTTLLKDAILLAAEKAGGRDGLVGYLESQAKEHPAAFMTLLGKVLPMQVTGAEGGPVEMAGTEHITDMDRARALAALVARVKAGAGHG